MISKTSLDVISSAILALVKTWTISGFFSIPVRFLS